MGWVKTMKRNTIVLGIGIAAILLSTMPATAGTVVCFDDLTTAPRLPDNIPAGYGGFNWTNFGVAKDDHKGVNTGYYNAAVSGDYVAFNHYGDPASFSSDTPITLVGANFTAAWRDGLQVDVEGYLAGDLVYSTAFTIDTYGPKWIQFDWDDVDQVMFRSSGGVGVGFAQDSYQFAMDNLSYHTPAPGAIILAGFGTGLTSWLRRRRAL